MYIFRNDHQNTYTRVERRAVSGDLKVSIIDADTFQVDQSEDWLFDFEKNDPKCYARRMQARGTIPRGVDSTTTLIKPSRPQYAR